MDQMINWPRGWLKMRKWDWNRSYAVIVITGLIHHHKGEEERSKAFSNKKVEVEMFYASKNKIFCKAQILNPLSYWNSNYWR